MTDKAARAALLTAKGVDNKSENIADYVADLLRQGRAKEVTDDLMAQADPQRLHQHYTTGNTGMDLPMDQASRMARAAQMGYTNEEYRGVTGGGDRSAPRKRYDGERNNNLGFWTSNNPDVASSYAHPEAGSVYKFLTKEPQGGFPEVDVKGGEWHNIPKDFSIKKGGENIPLTEYAPLRWDEYASNHIVNGAIKRGDSGVKFKNMIDAGGYDHYDNGNGADIDPNSIAVNQPSDITARVDPANIRSQFARFDPRLEHLAHLSASTGGAMEFARHVEAVNRAGGQIAPSKYLPDVPRQVHAAGGRIHAEDGGKMELRSRAAEAIRNQPQLKGNVNQLLAVAAKGKGVKQAELANAGRPTGNIISKEELAQHFEDAVPKVQVKELKNREPKPLSSSEMAEYRRLEADPFGYGQDGYDRLQELEDRQHGEIKARYQQYTLPQGENYREHLLHLPAEHGPDSWTNFRSSHWETPNVIAHLRMKDRDNGKTLHVEEVQSDWGQEGRERGFYDIAKPFHVFDTKTGQTVHEASTADEAEAVADKLGPQYDYQSQHDDMPPKGPYVGNTQQWTDLALKHALTEAAKGGHDRVVLSPGEANADLYGQRTPITNARLVWASPEAGYLYTRKKDAKYDSDAIQFQGEKHLSSLLGKQHAKALLAQDGLESSISEPDMHLGGHGMVDYYNNIVHPSALKLLQQHDPSIKPESYDLPNGYKGFGLPMTDTARQSILKNGFGAFKRGGMVGKEEGGATGSLREKALWPSAQAIKAGTGSREAHAEMVNKIKPVSPYAAPVPPASDEQVHDALTKDKQPKAFAPRGLEEGTPVAVRLDIPAYEKKNTWVVSVHHPKTDFTAGEVIGYDSVAHIGNPRFGVHPTGALNIASGKPKSTIATVHGNWKKTTPEDAFALSQTVHNDPQWRQVGMDPERHSYFYDRETQEPVMAADEALHIGPLVYAKNPVYGKKTDFAFSSGGDVSAAIALTRRFTKDGAGATMALKPKGK
jgi:hypothetical protein